MVLNRTFFTFHFGKGEACSQIAALLFAIDEMTTFLRDLNIYQRTGLLRKNCVSGTKQLKERENLKLTTKSGLSSK